MRESLPDRKELFDVVVVGSGATGGWAAKELTEASLRVALVEAGPNLDPDKEFREHVMPFELPYRGASPEIARTRPIQSRCYACTEYNYQWFVNDLENPYTTPPDKPFNWYRVRRLGGRSLVWYRLSYRMGDLDFKAAERDGYGENWPLSYAELEPYYDKVEQFIGVSGMAEGLAHLPDGKFLPPMAMTCGEILLRKTAKAKFGRTVTIGRQAIVTVPHNGRANSSMRSVTPSTKSARRAWGTTPRNPSSTSIASHTTIRISSSWTAVVGSPAPARIRPSP